MSPFPARPPVDRQVVGERTSLPLLRRRDLWGLGLGIPDTHEAVERKQFKETEQLQDI